MLEAIPQRSIQWILRMRARAQAYFNTPDVCSLTLAMSPGGWFISDSWGPRTSAARYRGGRDRGIP